MSDAIPSEATGTSLAQGSWDELARTASSGPKGDEVVQPLRELLVFMLGETPYAIPVDRVRETVRMCPVTRMPRVPEFILGVISLRGEIFQVIDLRNCFGMESLAMDRASRIIVLHAEEGYRVGILVDSVTEVLRVKEEDLLPATAGKSDAIEALCVRGDEFVSLIDLDRVLDCD